MIFIHTFAFQSSSSCTSQKVTTTPVVSTSVTVLIQSITCTWGLIIIASLAVILVPKGVHRLENRRVKTGGQFCSILVLVQLIGVQARVAVAMVLLLPGFEFLNGFSNHGTPLKIWN